jgi:hypothetical protein
MICLAAVLALVGGAAAGFQGIYDRYGGDSGRAAGTFWGVVYLLSRGAVPAAIFLLFFRGTWNPWLYALGCCTVGEGVLRAQFYWRSEKTNGGVYREVYKGTFAILRFWQGFFLRSIAGRLAELRQQIVRESLPVGATFKDLTAMVRKNGRCLSDPRVRRELEKEVERLEGEYDGAYDEEYRHQLGYIILDKVDEKALKALLKP